MDPIPRTLPAVRLSAFAVAVAGAGLALVAAVAGEATLAVQGGIRVVGAGLAAMGVATVRIESETPGEGDPTVARLRGVALAGVGLALALVPGAVAAAVGPA